MRPSPGGRGRTRGLSDPKPRVLIAGGTVPGPRRLSSGAPPPDPGVLFPRRKSTQKGARETLDPLFCLIGLC